LTTVRQARPSRADSVVSEAQDDEDVLEPRGDDLPDRAAKQRLAAEG
jgi:hypothetical protein